MRVRAFRCATCNSEDLIAVKPGFDDVRDKQGNIVERGEPIQAWCIDHWPFLQQLRAAQQ